MSESTLPRQRRVPATLQSAIDTYRRGEVDGALALCRRYIDLTAGRDLSGHAVMGEVLFRDGRIGALTELLDGSGDFLVDPRGRLLRSKALLRTGDAAGAEALLTALVAIEADSDAVRPIQRIAAFDLSALLGQQGRYAESWQVAATAHRRAGRRYPVDQLVEALRVTAEASTAELLGLPRASRQASRSAVILGMPRSGTTLLEQMLDCHPQVVGVGELALPGEMADAMASQGGGWPVGALRAPVKMLNEMQKRYLWETRGRRGLATVRADDWTVEKTVFPMQQPLFIAGVLPGAKVVHITRDARDNAVSLFLNNFDPSWAWTSSLDGIRRVLAAERRYVPQILERLGIDVMNLRFEDLVDRPEPMMREVLSHLGLEWHEACLQPQANTRLVFTLSHEQVRQPVNRQGIGRWRNYESAFDASWDALR